MMKKERIATVKEQQWKCRYKYVFLLVLAKTVQECTITRLFVT